VTNPYAPPRAAVQDIPAGEGQMVPADRGTRLGAAILDGLIAAVMIYLPFGLGIGVAGAFSAGSGGSAGSGVDAIMGGAGLIALAGFAVWGWLTFTYVKRNGQTIAKKLLNIKVVRSDGSSASVGRIFWLRNVLNTFISIVPLYGIVDMLFIFGEARQCLHDKIADTIVIRA